MIEGYLGNLLVDGEMSELASWLDEDAAHRTTFLEAIQFEYSMGSHLKAREALGDEKLILMEEKGDKRAVPFPKKTWMARPLRVAAMLAFCAPLTWLLWLGVIMLLGAPTRTLADVAKAMEGFRYVHWQQLEINKNVFDFLGVDQVEQKRTSYFDMKGHRSRLVTHYPFGDYIQIQHHKTGKTLWFNPQDGTTTITKSRGLYLELADELAKVAKKPEPMRHPFESVLKAGDVKITKAKLDGVDYGYAEIVDENNGVSGTLKIWLDLRTQLPFRTEYALPGLKLHYTNTGFTWTNELENAETLFQIDTPEESKAKTGDRLEGKPDSGEKKGK